MENTEVAALRAVISDMAATAVAEIARKTIQPQLYTSEQLELIIDDWVQKAVSGEVRLNDSESTSKSTRYQSADKR
jgi:hypothetical protein